MGLRERQRTSRRQRILDAALELFIEKGFDATKSEEIAEKAEMALGTIYNHFSSKGEILLTLAAIENENLEDCGDQFKIDPNATASDAFLALIGSYYDPKNLFLNKDLWRIAFAQAFTDISSSGARRLRQSDKVLTQQVVDLARALQTRKLIPERIDPEILGTTLFNTINMLFFEFTRSENMTEEQVRKMNREALNSILQLAMPEIHADQEGKNG
jgi:AcrR family transcriptional regulator